MFIQININQITYGKYTISNWTWVWCTCKSSGLQWYNSTIIWMF